MFRWYGYVTILYKYMLPCTFVVLCILSVGLLAVNRAQPLRDTVNVLATDLIPMTDATHDLLGEVSSADASIRTFLVPGQESSLNTYERHLALIDADLSTITAHDSSFARLHLMIQNQLIPQLQAVTRLYDSVVVAEESGKYAQADQLMNSLPRLLSALNTRMSAVFAEEDAIVSQAHQSTQTTFTSLTTQVYSWTLFVALLTFLLTLTITHSISRRLGRLVTAARLLATGGTAIDSLVSPTSGDELGMLGSSLLTVASYLKTITASGVSSRASQSVKSEELARTGRRSTDSKPAVFPPLANTSVVSQPGSAQSLRADPGTRQPDSPMAPLTPADPQQQTFVERRGKEAGRKTMAEDKAGVIPRRRAEDWPQRKHHT